MVVEPEPASCRAAGRLFGLPAVAAAAERLPFASGSFRIGWSLAVLCTTEAQEAVLRELRRVVRDRIGLLVYVRTVPELPEQPSGNVFPTDEGLARLLAAAGLRVVDRTPIGAVSRRPDGWTERADAVERALEHRHGAHPAWRRAARQRAVLGRLQDQDLVRGLALVAERADTPP